MNNCFIPSIARDQIDREVSGSQATLLQSCFSPGVIGLGPDGKAFVRDARYDTCSRNVYRYDEIKDAVILSRVRDHFICVPIRSIT
ncbi:hypothetical protein MSG28_006879 [Choristoneura fumiferana]|uniref:Uncharacterized protein n=1 Tax=Choristoneura fumiferana TaxID=7141 RepID=A0ACC0JLE5_CHOFU|nr:hypothetical protein MSG28_006879 [Choristoneura fumiferana]